MHLVIAIALLKDVYWRPRHPQNIELPNKLSHFDVLILLASTVVISLELCVALASDFLI